MGLLRHRHVLDAPTWIRSVPHRRESERRPWDDRRRRDIAVCPRYRHCRRPVSSCRCVFVIQGPRLFLALILYRVLTLTPTLPRSRISLEQLLSSNRRDSGPRPRETRLGALSGGQRHGFQPRCETRRRIVPIAVAGPSGVRWPRPGASNSDLEPGLGLERARTEGSWARLVGSGKEDGGWSGIYASSVCVCVWWDAACLVTREVGPPMNDALPRDASEGELPPHRERREGRDGRDISREKSPSAREPWGPSARFARRPCRESCLGPGPKEARVAGTTARGGDVLVPKGERGERTPDGRRGGSCGAIERGGRNEKGLRKGRKRQ